MGSPSTGDNNVMGESTILEGGNKGKVGKLRAPVLCKEPDVHVIIILYCFETRKKHEVMIHVSFYFRSDFLYNMRLMKLHRLTLQAPPS